MPTPFQGTAAANVTARLFNSAPVHTAMDEILPGVRRVLGVDRSTRASGPLEGNSGKSLPIRELSEDERHSDEDSAVSRSDRASSVGSNECDDRFETYQWRLAEDPSITSSASIEESDEPNGSTSRPDHDANHTVEITTSERSSDLDAKPAKPDHDKHPRKPPRTVNAPTTTTFLPSLTMGGYISGSDSEPNASDEAAANIQLRKNRRGQRARQAIWEKKYGAKAKHVVRQANGRDAGWDTRRGAVESGAPGKGKFGKGVERKQGGRPGGKSAVAPEKKAGSEKLHPSWEAAKKAKEGKKMMAFTGKKIVFN